MKRCVCPLLLAAALLAGCAGLPDSSAATDGTVPPSAATAAPTDPPPPAAEDYNPLTGLYDMNGASGSRPFGVMIGNNPKSRPQPGIEDADLYIETETEGGITRLLAVYSSAARAPERIGPVRSARTPFVKMAQSFDLLYAHAGGSPDGLSAIRSMKVDDIDALRYDGSTFWRDDTLRKEKGLEYSMLTSGSRISDRISTLGYRATSTRTPFSFYPAEVAPAGAPAVKASVFFSGSYISTFLYDTATGLYRKALGEVADGKEASAALHKAESGKVLTVRNLLVLFDKKTYEEGGVTIDFQLTAGIGFVCTGGVTRPIGWKRGVGGWSFTEEDGTPMQLSVGKTYLCLVASGNKEKCVVG